MAFAGDNAESSGHLLYDIQDRDEQEFREEQAVSPCCSGLSSGDRATHVGVCQHHYDSWAPDSQETQGHPFSQLVSVPLDQAGMLRRGFHSVRAHPSGMHTSLLPRYLLQLYQAINLGYPKLGLPKYSVKKVAGLPLPASFPCER